MSRYSEELSIFWELEMQYQHEYEDLKRLQEKCDQQLLIVHWYQWVDVVLTHLGPGWDIISDTSDPQISGNVPQTAEEYKGQVTFGCKETLTKVWTKYQGVVWVEHPGSSPKLFVISGPHALEIIEEFRLYVMEGAIITSNSREK